MAEEPLYRGDAFGLMDEADKVLERASAMALALSQAEARAAAAAEAAAGRGAISNGSIHTDDTYGITQSDFLDSTYDSDDHFDIGDKEFGETGASTGSSAPAPAMAPPPAMAPAMAQSPYAALHADRERSPASRTPSSRDAIRNKRMVERLAGTKPKDESADIDATLVVRDRLGRRVVLRRRQDDEREEAERQKEQRRPTWRGNFSDAPPQAELLLESSVHRERARILNMEARGFVQPPASGSVKERASLARLSYARGKRAVSDETRSGAAAVALADEQRANRATQMHWPSTSTTPRPKLSPGLEKLGQDSRERKWIERLEARGVGSNSPPRSRSGGSSAEPAVDMDGLGPRNDGSAVKRGGHTSGDGVCIGGSGGPTAPTEEQLQQLSSRPRASSRASLPKLKAILPKASRGIAARSGSAPPERPPGAQAGSGTAASRAPIKKPSHGAALSTEELFKLRYPEAAEIAYPPPQRPKGDPIKAEDATVRGLVVTRVKLKVRSGHTLDTEDVGDLPAGSTVRTIDQCELPDGTQRACVAIDGERESRGWVSAITKDGVENFLQPDNSEAMTLVAELEISLNQMVEVKSSRLADAGTPYIRRHGDPASLIMRSVEEARQGIRNAPQHSAVALTGTVLAGSASLERGRGY